jgi:hypothetical protein
LYLKIYRSQQAAQHWLESLCRCELDFEVLFVVNFLKRDVYCYLTNKGMVVRDLKKLGIPNTKSCVTFFKFRYSTPSVP